MTVKIFIGQNDNENNLRKYNHNTNTICQCVVTKLTFLKFMFFFPVFCYKWYKHYQK